GIRDRNVTGSSDVCSSDLHFRLGRGANFDYSHATDQFRQPLLQLLAVVVAGGLIDLAANFLHPAFDVGVLAFTFDDGGVVLVNGDLLGLSDPPSSRSRA